MIIFKSKQKKFEGDLKIVWQKTISHLKCEIPLYEN